MKTRAIISKCKVDVGKRSPLELILNETVVMEADIGNRQTVGQLIRLAAGNFYFEANEALEKCGVKYFDGYVHFAFEQPELRRICGDDGYFYELLDMPCFSLKGAFFCKQRRRAAAIAFAELFSDEGKPYATVAKIEPKETEERDYLRLATNGALEWRPFEIIRVVSEKEVEIRPFHVGSRYVYKSKSFEYVYRSNPNAKTIIVRRRRDGNYGRGKNIYVPSDTPLVVSLKPFTI